MELVWRKRRWYCRAPWCGRKSFTESMPAVPAGARITTRLREHAGDLVVDGLCATVAAAGRMTGVSWPTAMDAVRAAAERVLDEAPDPVEVLGVDEVRRGRPRWRPAEPAQPPTPAREPPVTPEPVEPVTPEPVEPVRAAPGNGQSADAGRPVARRVHRRRRRAGDARPGRGPHRRRRRLLAGRAHPGLARPDPVRGDRHVHGVRRGDPPLPAARDDRRRSLPCRETRQRHRGRGPPPHRHPVARAPRPQDRPRVQGAQPAAPQPRRPLRHGVRETVEHPGRPRQAQA